MTKPQWSGDFPAWGQFFQHKSKMNGDSVVFSNISVVENFFLRRWKTFDDFSDLCSVLWTERYLNTVENMSWEILGIYRGYYMVQEDMNFMFEWQEQYLTSERSERVRYCSCHENIKFISSSQRVMFFLLYGETNSTKAKGGNRDAIERYDTHKGDIRKIRHSGPGWSGLWNLRVV